MQKIQTLVFAAFAAICLNFSGKVAAQPAASMPEEPSVLECREAHTASQLCPAATNPNPGGGGTGGGGGGGVDLPHACIYGQLVSYDEYSTAMRSRGLTPAVQPRGYHRLQMRHDNVALSDGTGTADVGIGGVCLCPAGFGIRPVAAGFDSTRGVEAEVHRSIDRRNSMQCVPTGGVQAPFDIGPFVVRLDQDERTLFLHMCTPHHTGMSSEEMLTQFFPEWLAATPDRRNELCPNVDNDTDTNNTEELWRRWCVRAGNDVTFEEFNAATPARREEMCPPSESEEGESNNGVRIEGFTELNMQHLFSNRGVSDNSALLVGGLNFCGQSGENCFQLRLGVGGGNMSVGGGLEPGRHQTYLSGVGYERVLGERLRLNAGATITGTFDTGRVFPDGGTYGDGWRSVGFGARIGLTVDINRSSHSDRRVTPYVGVYAGYEYTRFNMLNDNAQTNWMGGNAGTIGFTLGLRFGR